jgi:hypothetical protein
MIKRWPLIRHVRYFYHAWRLYRWARAWNSIGIGIGPNPADIDHLEAIWRGKA